MHIIVQGRGHIAGVWLVAAMFQHLLPTVQGMLLSPLSRNPFANLDEEGECELRFGKLGQYQVTREEAVPIQTETGSEIQMLTRTRCWVAMKLKTKVQAAGG